MKFHPQEQSITCRAEPSTLPETVLRIKNQVNALSSDEKLE